MNKSMVAFFGGCLMLASQVSLAAEPKAAACGGVAGQKCEAPAEYCELGTGKCDVQDAVGTCKKKPEICTKEFVPVCGCNGQTYGNKCEAAVAGVSVNHAGACEKKPK